MGQASRVSFGTELYALMAEWALTRANHHHPLKIEHPGLFEPEPLSTHIWLIYDEIKIKLPKKDGYSSQVDCMD